MILKALIGEFEHEVNSTRKLLQAVPQKDITYKPSPVSWTMGLLMKKTLEGKRINTADLSCLKT